MRIHSRTLTAALTCLLVGSCGSAQARPTIRQAFFATYPGAVGSKLDNLSTKSGHCGVCHFDFNGGGLRNAYGVAVGNAYNGKDAAAAIVAVRTLDPDADGFPTDTEVTNKT